MTCGVEGAFWTFVGWMAFWTYRVGVTFRGWVAALTSVGGVAFVGGGTSGEVVHYLTSSPLLTFSHREADFWIFSHGEVAFIFKRFFSS